MASTVFIGLASAHDASREWGGPSRRLPVLHSQRGLGNAPDSGLFAATLGLTVVGAMRDVASGFSGSAVRCSNRPDNR